MNRSFTVFSLALLLLTGCSGSDKSQDAAGSASATSSASVSASAGSAGSTGNASAQADGSSSSSASSTSTEAKPAPTFGPNHQELELTAEEQKAYQAGEYVPATEKHPALNVPVPVEPAKIKEHSFEGAVALANYWVEATNYATQTGDTSFERAILDSDWETEQNLMDAIDETYLGHKWFAGSITTMEVDTSGFSVEYEDLGDLIIVVQRTEGNMHDLEGSAPDPQSGYNKSGQPNLFTVRWDGSEWKAHRISGIRGVTYDESK